MHLTDEQLNEYLDHELQDRVQVEMHLSSCDECAARLSQLKNLFDEIESLPEINLSRSLVPHFVPHTPSLPRWLTLTATLQAALAILTIIIGTPFVLQLTSPYLSDLEAPSFGGIFLVLQSQWMALLDMLSALQLPRLPEIPVVEVSSLALALILAAVSALWIVGNGLLLRNNIK